MANPAELKYTKDHEWIRVEGDVAFVGITDYAQGHLGDIVYIDIDKEGEMIDKEDTFGSIEAVKTVSDMFMPLTGELLEINPLLDEKPEMINQDPYGDGWIIKISITKTDEVNGLLSAEQYNDIIDV